MLEYFIAILVLNAFGLAMGYLLQTDKFTDILYSFSFLVVVAIGWIQLPVIDGPQLIVGLLVILWALRLGGYLFYRIHQLGRDTRFDEMRPSFSKFMGFWALQTISIGLIALPVIFILDKGMLDYEPLVGIGTTIWLLGMIIETTADMQKYQFRSDPVNDGRFIQSGLWKSMRHPNYLGEILVWIGTFIACVPYLEGIEWLGMVSPIWIFVLLRFISGVPLLEESARKKYGDQPTYHAYLERTGRLLPKLW